MGAADRGGAGKGQSPSTADAAPKGYEFVDMQERGSRALETAFANQVAYCQANDAPVTGRIVAAIWAAVAGGAVDEIARRVREWPGAPLADALPLRIAGGLHALQLSDREPSLTPLYAGGPASDGALVARVFRDHADFLLPWLDGPPQTNEAGRSWAFVAGMLWLAARGLPGRFECLEIGASAGINLMLDRYAYDLGGVLVGPGAAAMRIAPDWRGPPPPNTAVAFVRLLGCDVAPVDLTDPAQALRLRAYVWPEHRERFARLEAAIAAAHKRPPAIAQVNAADFIEDRLALPQAIGTTRVVMHSVVWQYVSADQQARVTEAMRRAGAQASADRPLAWLSLEANRTVHRHELTVRYWPGGAEPVRLGTAHPHGAWVDWQG